MSDQDENDVLAFDDEEDSVHKQRGLKRLKHKENETKQKHKNTDKGKEEADDDPVPMDEDDDDLELLSGSDDEPQPTSSLKRLKRKDANHNNNRHMSVSAAVAKRKKKRVTKKSAAEILANPDKEKVIVGGFGFMEPDEDIYSDESVEEGEEDLGGFVDSGRGQMSRKKIRENIGMLDEEVGLHEAFLILASGNWIRFLGLKVIREKVLDFVNGSLKSFGDGTCERDLRNLLDLAWRNELVVYKRRIALVDHVCIACNIVRTVTYEIYEIVDDHYLLRGFMGPECYGIRFLPLIDLAYGCKQIAADLAAGQWGAKTEQFKTFVTNKLESLLSYVAGSSHEMQENQEVKEARRERLINRYGSVIRYNNGKDEDASKPYYISQADKQQGNDAICERNADDCEVESIPHRQCNFMDLTNNGVETHSRQEEIDDNVRLYE